jgi:hypothetical protein
MSWFDSPRSLRVEAHARPIWRTCASRLTALATASIRQTNIFEILFRPQDEPMSGDASPAQVGAYSKVLSVTIDVTAVGTS